MSSCSATQVLTVPQGQPLLKPNADESADDTYGDVAAAFRTRRANYTFGTIDGREYARAAIPFISADQFLYVLAVRKPIDQISGRGGGGPQRVRDRRAGRPAPGR